MAPRGVDKSAQDKKKPTSRSARAGLQFPVGRVHRLLKVRRRRGAPGWGQGRVRLAACQAALALLRRGARPPTRSRRRPQPPPPLDTPCAAHRRA